MHRSLGSLTVAALLFASGVSPVHAIAEEQPSVLVTASDGVLKGTVTPEGVRVFLGIPYAQAPIGELRWMAPNPVKAWPGVRNATAFGPRAIQPRLWDDMVFRSTRADEDCLYLNVWSPPPGNAPCPVLVYFHGGGLVAGDGSEPRYDGTQLARRGVVVVTLNYRLGVLGFLAHPEFSRELTHGGSGNYGFLDQRAALKWVQSNITAFGGDPRRVTIAGQSAGAGSVSAHVASELSRGLFIAAIGQSGAFFGERSPVAVKEAEERGLLLQKAAGARDIRELRALSADQLLAVSEDLGVGRCGPVIDGNFFREDILETYENGRQSDVPLIAGWTSQEVGARNLLGSQAPSLVNFRRVVTDLYGPHAEEVLQLYPAEGDSDVTAAAAALASDRFVAYNTWKWIDVHSKSNGKPVYQYLFVHPPALPTGQSGQRGAYAAHSSDIPYWFGNLPLLPHEWTEADYRTSEIMQRILVNFVTNQDPNGPGVPAWPWIRTSIPKILVLSSDPKVEREPHARRYETLNRINSKQN